MGSEQMNPGLDGLTPAQRAIAHDLAVALLVYANGEVTNDDFSAAVQHIADTCGVDDTLRAAQALHVEKLAQIWAGPDEERDGAMLP